MTVLFQTKAGVFTAPLRPTTTPPSFADLVRLQVTAPRLLTDHPAYSFALNLNRGGQASIQSPKSPVLLTPDFSIPLGGRERFATYADVVAGKLFVIRTVKKKGAWAPDLRPSFGSRPPRLTLVSPSAMTILDDPLREPRVQGDREAADAEGLYVRGLRLTDPFATSLPTINGTSGTWTATPMSLAVVRRPLGGRTVSFIEKGKPVSVVNNTTKDFEIQTVASRYGIPPQYLKRQVQGESNFRDKSYRYEPLTIDLRNLTGDGSIRDKHGVRTVYSPSGARWIRTYPYDKYAIGTPILNGATTTTPPLAFNTAGQTTFSLGGSPVFSRKRMPFQSSSSDVRASITGSSRILNAEPTYPGTLWSRGGQPQLVSPPATTDTRHWKVDFNRGEVALYKPLVAGETLTVTFEPITYDGAAVGNGSFSDPSAQTDEKAKLFDLNQVTPQIPALPLSYVPGETIAGWLQRGLVAHPGGGFLATDSERALHFDNATKQAIDTRLGAVNAQFYAAASYGPLQVTLDAWTQPQKRLAFDQILKVEDVPIYKIAIDWEAGLALGAEYHKQTIETLKISCSPCNQEAWEKFWSKVFHEYNSLDPGQYFLQGDQKIQIIKDGTQYEPQ
jgi:hypothetical protein